MCVAWVCLFALYIEPVAHWLTRLYDHNSASQSWDSTQCCHVWLLKEIPSFFEHANHNCNIMSSLAGPLCSSKDCIAFTEGQLHRMAHHMNMMSCPVKEPSHLDGIQPLFGNFIFLLSLAVCYMLPVEWNIHKHFKGIALCPTKGTHPWVSLHRRCY